MDMKQFTLQRIAYSFMTALMTVVMFVVAIFWLQPENPEFVSDDEFTITVTIGCAEVLTKPENFSESIVLECRNKLKFAKPVVNTTV